MRNKTALAQVGGAMRTPKEGSKDILGRSDPALIYSSIGLQTPEIA